MVVNATIYWAGPLFTQAERIWNRLCAKELRDRGHLVLLPQDEAKEFITDKGVDALSIARKCRRQCINSPLMVAILDGADTDSGTGVEIGLRIGSPWDRYTPFRPIIGIRTDFRASEDGQLNAMFRLIDKIIYFPSFNEDHKELCDQIDAAIQEIFK